MCFMGEGERGVVPLAMGEVCKVRDVCYERGCTVPLAMGERLVVRYSVISIAHTDCSPVGV